MERRRVLIDDGSMVLSRTLPLRSSEKVVGLAGEDRVLESLADWIGLVRAMAEGEKGGDVVYLAHSGQVGQNNLRLPESLRLFAQALFLKLSFSPNRPPSNEPGPLILKYLMVTDHDHPLKSRL